jgi:hypothetical protein
MTEMLLGKPPSFHEGSPFDAQNQSAALQDMIEIYLHGILA